LNFVVRCRYECYDDFLHERLIKNGVVIIVWEHPWSQRLVASNEALNQSFKLQTNDDVLSSFSFKDDVNWMMINDKRKCQVHAGCFLVVVPKKIT
jgi:hypothetical protein